MRDARYLSAIATLMFTACSAAPGAEPNGASERALATTPSGPTLTFAADWTQTVSGSLVAEGQETVAYDDTRLNTCRGTLPGGQPGWSITAFYTIDGIELGSFPVAGQGLSNTPKGPLFTPPFAGDLAMWFQISSAWGCSAYDSNYSNNYHFTVAAPENAPGWVGGTSAIIDRATCGVTTGTRACYADARPADQGFTFDTWARSQAAVHEVYFDVWKEGVTDFQNPDLWQALDVQLYWRVAGQTEFTTSYVDFSEYSGNNARYAIDLAAKDPLPSPNGNGLTDASRCPAISATLSADGQYVQTNVDYFFTVNGVAVTPAAGGVFTGLYQNYAPLYAICKY